MVLLPANDLYASTTLLLAPGLTKLAGGWKLLATELIVARLFERYK
jgi:hypothetical protein